ncbi:hypothetical protein DERF_013230 [Dermatophagoides farinae]|uniref:Uncharacterized protein n=1 Tax=Dermatophagoides farinae TaxID=6954 RepID=A0A922HP26_DERFA|nr:hypothetical protein DERF_013230 [Dermatophagoides farinae]
MAINMSTIKYRLARRTKRGAKPPQKFECFGAEWLTDPPEIFYFYGSREKDDRLDVFKTDRIRIERAPEADQIIPKSTL